MDTQKSFQGKHRGEASKSGIRRFSLFYGKVVVHPLFLLLGIWNVFTGELLAFLSVAVCAVLHEFAHAATAARYGFVASELVLMPYGATIEMDLEGVSPLDEIRIALAGPICNFLIAGGFLALWWCYPSTYPYTETAYYATLSLAICNLFPAYPLDGGRVLFSLLYFTLNKYLPPTKSKKVAKTTMKIFTVFLCCIGLFFFVFGMIKGKTNPSLLLFMVFVAMGIFEKNRTIYCKLDFSNRRAFERGISVRRIAVLEDCTIKRALSFLSGEHYLILDVYNIEERYVGSITQSELSDFFQKTHLYAKLSEYFA